MKICHHRNQLYIYTIALEQIRTDRMKTFYSIVEFLKQDEMIIQ